jgi:hypothetical protein
VDTAEGLHARHEAFLALKGEIDHRALLDAALPDSQPAAMCATMSKM